MAFDGAILPSTAGMAVVDGGRRTGYAPSPVLLWLMPVYLSSSFSSVLQVRNTIADDSKKSRMTIFITYAVTSRVLTETCRFSV